MRLFTVESIERLGRLGARLRRGMEEILKVAGVCGAVRGEGSLVSLRFSNRPARDYRDIVTDGADMMLAKEFHRALLDEGVFCTSTLLFILSTPMDEGLIDMTLEKIEAALKRAIASR